MFFKTNTLEAEVKVESMQVFLTRLASCSHLGVISDSLMVSKFYNGINDPKGQEIGQEL